MFESESGLDIPWSEPPFQILPSSQERIATRAAVHGRGGELMVCDRSYDPVKPQMEDIIGAIWRETLVMF